MINEIRARRGKEFGDRLERFWVLRKSADYDNPEFCQPKLAPEDLSTVRLSARNHLGGMASEFDSYALQVESFLLPNRS